MADHRDIHLGILSPRAGSLVRLELVTADHIAGTVKVKIVPCDADGRTRPDDHPAPEIVELTDAADIAAFDEVRGTRTPVCWLRCSRTTEQT